MNDYVLPDQCIIPSKDRLERVFPRDESGALLQGIRIPKGIGDIREDLVPEIRPGRRIFRADGSRHPQGGSAAAGAREDGSDDEQVVIDLAGPLIVIEVGILAVSGQGREPEIGVRGPE